MVDPVAADVRAVLRAGAFYFRERGMTVSVSHAGHFGVLAVSDSFGALGVDTEPWDGEVPGPGFVDGTTSPEEFSTWSRLSASERRPAFIRLWTLKESALKARGTGLATDMRTVRLRPDFSATDEPGLSSALVAADADHAVALVWAGGPATIVVVPIVKSVSF